MSDRISAGELREMGLGLSAEIPDCATVARSSVRFKLSPPRLENRERQEASISASVMFIEPFSWITVDILVDDGRAA